MTEFALLWGVRATFVRYVARQPGASASVGGGAASTSDNRFVFPSFSADASADSTAATTMEFAGSVQFTAHGGILDLLLADPWLEENRRTLRLSFATRGANGQLSRTAVAELIEKPAGRHDEGRRHWEAKLTQQGSAVFGGMYSPGESLDPVFLIPSPLTALSPPTPRSTVRTKPDLTHP